MKTVLAFSFFLLGAVMMTDSVNAEVAVGDAVPAFKLTGSDGKQYTNEQFKDKKVVVIAWYPKAFTGG